MDKIEEKVVKAIEAVEFKKTEETIMTSPRLSVIDMENLVTRSMSATQSYQKRKEKNATSLRKKKELKM